MRNFEYFEGVEGSEEMNTRKESFLSGGRGGGGQHEAIHKK